MHFFFLVNIFPKNIQSIKIKMKFIILVENVNLSEYIKKLIIKNNDECIAAESINDLISAIDTIKPDWLFIDLQWTKENAFKLTEKIRIKHPDTNIALLSDVNDEKLRLKAEKVGASVLIPKENLYDFYKIILNKNHQGL